MSYEHEIMVAIVYDSCFNVLFCYCNIDVKTSFIRKTSHVA